MPPQMHITASPRHQHTTPAAANKPHKKQCSTSPNSQLQLSLPNDSITPVSHRIPQCRSKQSHRRTHGIPTPHQGPQLLHHLEAYGKELGRLAQGIPGLVQGTNTIVFIARTTPYRSPQRRHSRPDMRQFSSRERRPTSTPHSGRQQDSFQATVAHPQPTCSPQRSSSTASYQPKARFMTIDIKDFYLNTPMARPEFMRLKLADIPEDFITLYNLRNLATRRYAYVRIQKGIRTASGRHHSTTTP
eukprot:CCRYP_020916-RA/>CCRYP_020916-RA protein AED:0.40 eAED:0.40 QI:0/0/0/0.5/0/0/2/0/244